MSESDYTGRVFDSRYKVLKKVAKGGMGTVYLGEHALVGRKVAIKIPGAGRLGM
jgi:serine/threonine-protein kinase